MFSPSQFCFRDKVVLTTSFKINSNALIPFLLLHNNSRYAYVKILPTPTTKSLLFPHVEP